MPQREIKKVRNFLQRLDQMCTSGHVMKTEMLLRLTVTWRLSDHILKFNYFKASSFWLLSIEILSLNLRHFFVKLTQEALMKVCQ